MQRPVETRISVMSSTNSYSVLSFLVASFTLTRLFYLQGKQDLEGAEEYYSRAILADPMDGEALVMSAKLVWQLHRDHDKATSYFEQAIQATPTER